MFDQAQPHEAGEIVKFPGRQMTASPGRPYDLIDQLKMVKEQPLIIHAGAEGKLARLSGRFDANTRTFKRGRRILYAGRENFDEPWPSITTEDFGTAGLVPWHDS